MTVYVDQVSSLSAASMWLAQWKLSYPGQLRRGAMAQGGNAAGKIPHVAQQWDSTCEQVSYGSLTEMSGLDPFGANQFIIYFGAGINRMVYVIEGCSLVGRCHYCKNLTLCGVQFKWVFTFFRITKTRLDFESTVLTPRHRHQLRFQCKNVLD